MPSHRTKNPILHEKLDSLREQRLRLERLAQRFLGEAVSSLDDAYSARMFLYARAARLIVAALKLLEKADKK